MTKWTPQQDGVLWEHGNEGAERCADIIRRRYGVARTPEAVRRHAYRIGAPIIEYHVCVGCGAMARSVDEEGLCAACHQRRLTEEYRMRSARIKRDFEEVDRGFDAARREYDRERQRKSRRRRGA